MKFPFSSPDILGIRKVEKLCFLRDDSYNPEIRSGDRIMKVIHFLP